jgi:hypothetical protein
MEGSSTRNPSLHLLRLPPWWGIPIPCCIHFNPWYGLHRSIQTSFDFQSRDLRSGLSIVLARKDGLCDRAKRCDKTEGLSQAWTCAWILNKEV